MVEQFKYLGKTRTNQNSIREKIKNRLKSGNACSHSVQNLSFSIVKAIPLQAWTGPEGSRRLRLPDIKTIGSWRW